MTGTDLRTSKRRWIKLYPNECLSGSIRWQLTPQERSAWYDLLFFSSVCSNTGDICDRDKNPIPRSFIANRLNISLQLLNSTIEKCKEEGRLTEDDKGFHITNWGKYQSEYDRQKPYRQAKKESEALAPTFDNDGNLVTEPPKGTKQSKLGKKPKPSPQPAEKEEEDYNKVEDWAYIDEHGQKRDRATNIKIWD